MKPYWYNCTGAGAGSGTVRTCRIRRYVICTYVRRYIHNNHKIFEKCEVIARYCSTVLVRYYPASNVPVLVQFLTDDTIKKNF